VRGSEVGTEVWKHGSASWLPSTSMREVQEGHSRPWETPVVSQTHVTSAPTQISLTLGEPLRARVRGYEVGPEVWKHGSGYWSTSTSMREVQEGHSRPWETPVGSQTHVISAPTQILLSLGEPLRARVRGSEVGPEVWKHGSAYWSHSTSTWEAHEGHSKH
jgi:hypothetical protein